MRERIGIALQEADFDEEFPGGRARQALHRLLIDQVGLGDKRNASVATLNTSTDR